MLYIGSPVDSAKHHPGKGSLPFTTTSFTLGGGEVVKGEWRVGEGERRVRVSEWRVGESERKMGEGG